MQSNVSTIDDCLYLYEVNVTQQHSMDVLPTIQQYGYKHSIVLKLSLPKDELYTLNIIRITPSRHLVLNAINFSKYPHAPCYIAQHLQYGCIIMSHSQVHMISRM